MASDQTIMLVSSEASAGALNVSASKDSFEVNFPGGLKFPAGSRPRMCVANASVWFSMANISASKNNNTWTYNVNGVTYTIVLTDGLYDLTGLNEEMSANFVNRGFPANLFWFTGVAATGYVLLNKIATSTPAQMTFGPGSPGPILGFNAGPGYVYSLGATTLPWSIQGEYAANLNSLQSIILNCSLAQGCSTVGGRSSAAIAMFSPGDAGVGMQIQFTPSIPQWVSMPNLAGETVFSMRLWLTDQSGVPHTIQTPDDWAATLILETQQPR